MIFRPNRSWSILLQTVAGASRSVILSALFFLILATPAMAIVDFNNNGASDIWEKQYNGGNLYTTFNPNADPDGDGWTNLQEAVTGTDPADANPPTGFLRPEITHYPAVYLSPEEEGDPPLLISPAITSIEWPTLAGKTYTLSASTDLAPGSWTQVGETRIGSTSILGANIPLTQPDGSIPEKLFLRVAAEDTDSDGDELTDAEENELGTSSFFADTNDDGIDDEMAVRMGLNPAGDTADADGDGVPDNQYYSVELQFEYETHFNYPPEPFLYTDREELNSRYFTNEWAFDYSVTDSPRYAAIADGSYIHKTTVLDDGVLLMDGSEIVTEEGEQLNPWLSAHGVTLADGEYIVWLQTQTVVSEPVSTVTAESSHWTSTTTYTTAWTVKKRQGQQNAETDPVQRSGTEVIANTEWNKRSELMSYPDFWEDYVKPTSWETSTQQRGPLYQVGQLIGSVGYEEAALVVRDAFKNGSFGIYGTISSPDVSGGGRDERVKAVRWRWVRFNPLNPFEYEYAAPPASYRKTFRLPVTQRDRLGEDHFGDIEDTTVAKGVIEVECLGSQGGTGWHEVSMDRFEDYRVEDPVHLDLIGFSGKGGDTAVTFQNMPAEVVSRDRMIAGKFTIPWGWEEGFEIQFVNTTTGEDLGTYGHLLDNQYGPRFDYSDSRLFDEWERQGYEAGTLDPRISTQGVTFCGNRSAGYPIEFYTVFAAAGDVEIRLIHNGDQVGVIKQTLTVDAAFGRVIDYVNELVGDPSPSVPPVLAGAPAPFGGPVADSIRPLARRVLIPFFNGGGVWLAAQQDSEALILGLLEGIKQGALDDKKLIEWVQAQNIQLQYALPTLLILQVQRWTNDPYTRALEAANAIRNVVQHGLIDPMQSLGGQLGDLAGNFSSWERFKEFNWRVHQGVQAGEMLALLLITDSAGVILQGLGAWYVEFCDRMYEGAELSVFQSISMGNLPAWRQDLRTFYRTFGYSLGYLGEQLLLGHGVGALYKGMAKLGPQIALTTLPAVKQFGVRILPFLNKRWAAKVLPTVDYEAAERATRATQTSRLDARAVINTDGAKPVADALDEAISRQFDKLNGKVIAEEIGNSPKIMQTLRQEATRTLFFDRLGMMEKLIGTKLDDVAAKNFIRTYERTILLNANTGEDMFDLFIKSFHSNFAPNGPLDNISAAGKDLLEYFLKEPNAGSPWKLGFAGSPNQNLGTLVRGNLIELHSAKVGRHKTASYLDELKDDVVEGLDFEYADGLVVQQTSTALAAASDLMVQKLRDSAEAALSAKGANARFQFDVHWLSNNGKPDLSRLEDLAIVLREELEISIEIIDTVTVFKQWLP